MEVPPRKPRSLRSKLPKLNSPRLSLKEWLSKPRPKRFRHPFSKPQPFRPRSLFPLPLRLLLERRISLLQLITR